MKEQEIGITHNTDSALHAISHTAWCMSASSPLFSVKERGVRRTLQLDILAFLHRILTSCSQNQTPATAARHQPVVSVGHTLPLDFLNVVGSSFCFSLHLVATLFFWLSMPIFLFCIRVPLLSSFTNLHVGKRLMCFTYFFLAACSVAGLATFHRCTAIGYLGNNYWVSASSEVWRYWGRGC